VYFRLPSNGRVDVLLSKISIPDDPVWDSLSQSIQPEEGNQESSVRLIGKSISPITPSRNPYSVLLTGKGEF
jgi:hypothetical protein